MRQRYMRPEDTLQQQVADYLKLRYPKVIFRSDFAAGIKMTMGQATKHKRMQYGRAYPDMFIAEPRGNWFGLFLELKKDGTRVRLKDGSLSTEQHIAEQAEMLAQLRHVGYRAEFAVGIEDAVKQIDDYMSRPVTVPDPIFGISDNVS